MSETILVGIRVFFPVTISCQADVFRWDNGALIPGTEGIAPGPGVQLDHKQLAYAGLSGLDLTGATFAFSNLTHSNFLNATLLNASFIEAFVDGVSFQRTTSKGFTKEQLYSTASYQSRNLQRIDLHQNNLTGWDFSDQDLTGCDFAISNLTNADLTGAIVSEASFFSAGLNTVVKEQLYSTASYQTRDMHGVGLGGNNLSGWDFSGQNLTNASFVMSTLTNANFAGAIVTGADFSRISPAGFTREQLYATASYAQENLQGIAFAVNQLVGWDFSGQDLRNANFGGSQLGEANFSGADLRGSLDWTPTATTIVRNTIEPSGTIHGLNLQAGEVLLVHDFDLGITLDEEMVIASNGRLDMQIEDANWESTFTVNPGVAPQIGGALRIKFGIGASLFALVGSTFDFFDWNETPGPSNRFSAVEIPVGTQWDLSNLYVTGEATLLSAVQADFNVDGKVDGNDFLLWQQNLGASGVNVTGDANLDGHVDADDLQIWKEQFGSSIQSALTAVPEPSIIHLCSVSGAVLFLRFRRRIVR